MHLFNPSHIPICHSGGVTRLQKNEFHQFSSGIFEKKGTAEKVELYAAIKQAMTQSIDQVLFNFSHWTWMAPIQLTVGNILRVSVPAPIGHAVFAVSMPTAIIGNMDKGEHCFPSLFLIDENNVLIGTTAHQVDNNPIGKTFDTTINIFCYESEGAPGWRKVLYSSLSNLSQGNANTAVLLLATAVELYADYLFAKDLEQKGVAQTEVEHRVSEVRLWRPKVARVTNILEVLLPGFDKSAFAEALGEFMEKVRNPRNAYVHRHSKDLTKAEAHEAFYAAFELLWKYDQLDSILDP